MASAAATAAALRRSALKRKLNQDRQFCNYVHRICMQNRLEGYNYCIRHILEDKTAPFRQCSFIHVQTGKRCTNASPRSERKESFLCPWHAKMAQRNKILAKRRHQPSMKSAILVDILDQPCHSAQAVKNNDRSANKYLELYESADESASDRDLPLAENAWKGDADSDGGSTDWENDDLLKHAGVYTAEEVALMLRDKLIKLQSLYIGQFKRLHHVLSERRRIYLKNVKFEKSIGLLSSTGNEPSPEAQELQNQLHALQHYHKSRGPEALLQKKSHDRRRAITDGLPFRHVSQSKCQFQEEGKKCLGASVPLSKFCFKHILSDTHQVLFEPCKGSDDCLKPVVRYTDNINCLIHTAFPKPKSELGEDNHLECEAQVPKSNRDTVVDMNQEPELFQTMDDIAALGLDVVQPGSLFGLNQFGDLGESADSTLSVDLMALNSSDILGSTKRSETTDATR